MFRFSRLCLLVAMACLALGAGRAAAQTEDQCQGLLEEVLIAVERGTAARDRADEAARIETFFWTEKAAGALARSCEGILKPDILAWLVDTRADALLRVRQWDLALIVAEDCIERHGDQGYCWLRGAEVMREKDRPLAMRRFLQGFEENRNKRLPAYFSDLAVELERWDNRRGAEHSYVTASITSAAELMVQRVLEAAGFDLGKPDGVIGPQSYEALAAFYKEAGLEVPPTPLGLLELSRVLFDLEIHLMDRPEVVAKLTRRPEEIEPFFEALVPNRQGSGVLLDRAGRILTASALIEGCDEVVVTSDWPGGDLFPATASVLRRDQKQGFAVLSSALRSGLWIPFPPEEDRPPTLAEDPAAGIPDGEAQGWEGHLLAGFPLYGPLGMRFAVSLAPADLAMAGGDLSREWLGSPLLDRRGRLAGLVVGSRTDGPGALPRLLETASLRQALEEATMEFAQGRSDDPSLSPDDLARRAQIMTVKIACYE